MSFKLCSQNTELVDGKRYPLLEKSRLPITLSVQELKNNEEIKLKMSV
jgi:hypothetical protein